MYENSLAQSTSLPTGHPDAKQKSFNVKRGPPEPLVQATNEFQPNTFARMDTGESEKMMKE